MSLNENLHNLKIYYTNNDYSVSYLIGHVTQKVKVIKTKKYIMYVFDDEFYASLGVKGEEKALLQSLITSLFHSI